MQDRYLERAGEPWPFEEERLLEEYFDEGLSIEDLAWVHMRSCGGIRSRLHKLGRIDQDPSTRRIYKIDRTLIGTY